MEQALTFEVDGTEYTLKMTYEGARMAESQGFNIEDVTNKPFSMIPFLLYAGLYSTPNRIKATSALSLMESIISSGQYTFGELTTALTEAYVALFE